MYDKRYIRRFDPKALDLPPGMVQHFIPPLGISAATVVAVSVYGSITNTPIITAAATTDTAQASPPAINRAVARNREDDRIIDR
eukprot:CAMPEP_0175057406 /NCGR_PEP_ID=MMETSP0052_2-20121109/11245_1 /TAXON_ID=51329 ORGANISM="Polytomella parva, Strain SAG 63-3" /NCGR_SAMPLE_ID=MMETSP0052_2 /ASSEMBLY_ACC=CAM_ASM_000194 /LENGTH=83 /DNA_ID=CAMNT_0016322613 /DNA_START=520 /DNA_END=771 /DNA_ORIENTATION=-